MADFERYFDMFLRVSCDGFDVDAGISSNKRDPIDNLPMFKVNDEIEVPRKTTYWLEEQVKARCKVIAMFDGDICTVVLHIRENHIIYDRIPLAGC